MQSSIRRRIVGPLASRARLARAIVAIACAGVFTASCGDKFTGNATGGTLSSIAVTPNLTTLAISGTQQFSAVGSDASGGAVVITPVWSVVAGGGTISSSGMFTAGTASGTFAATVRATSGSISNTATVTVTAGPLATVTITSGAISTAIGTTRQLAAEGKDASGNIVPLTPVWSIVAGGGTVSATGLFTAGMATGIFANTIQVSGGGMTATATATVTAGAAATIAVTPTPTTLTVGSAQQFTAVAKDAGGNVVAITPVWSVVNGGGTIASAGLFTVGTTTGTFANTVSAVAGGITGTATVVVTGGLASITMSVASASMAVGTTYQFTAVGKDANGTVIAITPAWSVVAGGGTIDVNSGLFTAGTTTGTFTNTVRATVGTLSALATAIVTGGAAAVISVTPNPAAVAAGATQQFTASGTDAAGNTTAVVALWSVVNGGGTINANTGVFTAGAVAGTYTGTIKATSGAISGVATVTVNPVVVQPRLTSIIVTPNPVTLLAGANQQFTATGRDQNGNIFPVFPAWSVVNGGGTIVTSTGIFTTGALAGTFLNTVQAASGAIAGFATVNVITTAQNPAFVNLGGAAADGIIAGTAVTCVSNGIIRANVSISPGNAISGFGPCVITGVQHLDDGVAQQDHLDLITAFNTLDGLPCTPANAIVADLGGTTKLPGTYCTASGIGVTGALTLDGNGDPNAVFLFKAGSSLTTAGSVILINGAQAKNVYWHVGSSATLGTASAWQGNILAHTSITLVDNTTLFGRALAVTGAVTLGTNNLITLP